MRSSTTPSPKIVPRFLINNFGQSEYERLIRGVKSRQRFAALLADECAYAQALCVATAPPAPATDKARASPWRRGGRCDSKQGFDGLVLEASYVIKHLGPVVHELAARLHQDGRELIVTLSYEGDADARPRESPQL